MDTDTGIPGIEGYVSAERLQRISQHLRNIDLVLVPYAPQLALPPFRDLSDPEALVRHNEYLKPADLVAIHLTDTFPADGIIHPTVYYNPAILRFSIHLTINSVSEDIDFHGARWSWENRKYAVLIPFEKIIPRVDEYNPGDTIVVDDLELPEGTIILNNTGNPEALPPAGLAQVAQADYSQAGEKLNGFHLAVYKQIIQMGYFPQFSHSDYGWGGLWGQYRHIHEDFCKRNGLVMGAGHRYHWSSKLEHFSLYLEDVAKTKDGEGFEKAVAEARENFLGRDLYGPSIPAKYKQALVQLLKKYGQQFPQVELPDI